MGGVVVVQSKGDLTHNGITLFMEGSVNLQLSAKSVGVFEAFYNSLKPIQLVSYTVEIAKPGKLYHSCLYSRAHHIVQYSCDTIQCNTLHDTIRYHTVYLLYCINSYSYMTVYCMM